MREILFKAKRANWRELPKEEWWIEGDLIHEPYGTVIQYYEDEIKDKRNCAKANKKNRIKVVVDPETVCEYTGLTDKNGRKIFENDICKGTFLPTERLTRKFRISYTSLKCRFSVADLDRGITEPIGAYINYNYKTEVIGNIFDNPDFLKAGQ